MQGRECTDLTLNTQLAHCKNKFSYVSMQFREVAMTSVGLILFSGGVGCVSVRRGGGEGRGGGEAPIR